jgi:AcrR family transcriptional regulator
MFMKVKPKPADYSSTEEKIKKAAGMLFNQKGYSATRTRDIAAEAGITLALLNYYFRNKEKLFEVIMLENVQKFMHGVVPVFNDEKASLEEKLELLVSRYIETCIEHPDILFFVLSEIRNSPEAMLKKMDPEKTMMNSHFMKQVKESIMSGKMTIHPMHFIANLMGLTVFPFLAVPILKKVGKLSAEDFNALMQQRKKMIPAWINMIMESK